MERVKALHKQTRGQNVCFKVKKKIKNWGHVPPTNSQDSVLGWPALQSTCVNAMLHEYLFEFPQYNLWDLHHGVATLLKPFHSSSRCVDILISRGTNAEKSWTGWHMASCSATNFKWISILLCLLGTVFYTLMRPRSTFHSVIPGTVHHGGHRQSCHSHSFPLFAVAHCK